jgi:hypothetical protein
MTFAFYLNALLKGRNSQPEREQIFKSMLSFPTALSLRRTSLVAAFAVLVRSFPYAQTIVENYGTLVPFHSTSARSVLSF